MQKEREEQEAWDKERENKINVKLQVILNKQSNELEAMKKSHRSTKVELESSMKKELAK